jgi:hypothetical protein
MMSVVISKIELLLEHPQNGRTQDGQSHWIYNTSKCGIYTTILILVKHGYLYQSHTTYFICVDFRFFFGEKEKSAFLEGGPLCSGTEVHGGN